MGNIFLGQFVGYFVLVILQFYVLHHVLHRHLRRWNPWAVLAVAFAISAAYLTFFNVTSPPTGATAEFVWNRGYWLLAVGWIFYFALGYYAGRHRDEILAVIARRRVAVVAGTVAAAGVLVLSLHSGVFQFVSSKRPDLLLYAPMVIALLALFSLQWPQPPRFLLLISNYSFSIYLLHWFTVDNLRPLHPHPAVNTIGLIIAGVGTSILVSKAINIFPWGKYLVGRPYAQRPSDYAPAATTSLRASQGRLRLSAQAPVPTTSCHGAGDANTPRG